MRTLLIMLLFTGFVIQSFAQQVTRGHAKRLKIDYSCMGLSNFPDTLSEKYQIIDLNNIPPSPISMDKCKRNRNKIQQIPLDKLSYMDSCHISVDEEYFFVENKVLINDSLRKKGISVSGNFDFLPLFNVNDSQNLPFHETESLETDPRIDRLKTDTYYSLYYILKYPYNFSGEHTMTMIIHLNPGGTCFISELLVDFKEKPDKFTKGYFGLYKIRRNRLIILLLYNEIEEYKLKNGYLQKKIYGEKAIFKVRKDYLQFVKSSYTFKSSYLSEGHKAKFRRYKL